MLALFIPACGIALRRGAESLKGWKVLCCSSHMCCLNEQDMKGSHVCYLFLGYSDCSEGPAFHLLSDLGQASSCLAEREHAGETPVLALCSRYHWVPVISCSCDCCDHSWLSGKSAALDSYATDCCFKTRSLCHSPVNGSCFAFTVHGAPKKLSSSHPFLDITGVISFCVCWPQHRYSR